MGSLGQMPEGKGVISMSISYKLTIKTVLVAAASRVSHKYGMRQQGNPKELNDHDIIIIDTNDKQLHTQQTKERSASIMKFLIG